MALRPLFNTVETAITKTEATKLYKTWLEANSAYHNGKAIMSDVEFDRLTKKLKPFYPDIEKVVGAEPKAKHASARKVRLEVPMASLDKAYAPDLANRIASHIGSASNVVISEKVDGASLQFRTKGGVTKIYTRGKNGIGQDVSHLLPYIERVGKLTNKETVRAEFVLPRSAKLEEDDIARNAVSGVINARTPSQRILKQAYPVALSIMDPPTKPSQAFAKLKKQGWRVPRYKVVSKSALTAKYLTGIYEAWQASAKYEIDGLVISADVAEKPSVSNPKRSFAFKVNAKGQVTEVLSVTWQASRYGQLKPVVNIKPVNVDGVKVSKATGHNAKYIVDNKIGPGAKVEIIRSGGVIPYIASVVKKAVKADLPKSSTYAWDATKVNIKLVGGVQSDVNARHLQNFFTKIGVLGFGPAVAKLVDDLHVHEVAGLDSDAWLEAGAGVAVSNKIPAAIKSALQSTTVPKLMAASGVFGQGFGETRAADLWRIMSAKTKPATPKALAKALAETRGWSVDTAKTVASDWKLWASWFNALPYKPQNNKKAVKGPLSGRVFLYTGVRDVQLSIDIEKAGGVVSNNMNKTVTDLIYKEGVESIKTQKAKAEGIRLIPYSQARLKLKL